MGAGGVRRCWPTGAVDWPQRADPDMVLPFGALMTMPSTAAAAAGAARSLITSGGEIADVDVLVAPRLLVETTRHQVAKPSFAELF